MKQDREIIVKRKSVGNKISVRRRKRMPCNIISEVGLLINLQSSAARVAHGCWSTFITTMANFTRGVLYRFSQHSKKWLMLLPRY